MGFYIEMRDAGGGPGFRGEGSGRGVQGKQILSSADKGAKMSCIGCLLLHKEPLQDGVA